MRVPLEVWDTVALIINNEFVEVGAPITAEVLVGLILGVNEDYYEEPIDE